MKPLAPGVVPGVLELGLELSVMNPEMLGLGPELSVMVPEVSELTLVLVFLRSVSSPYIY